MTTHEPVAALFLALANSDRLTILALLHSKPHNVKAICDHFPQSQPTISRHLKVLLDAHLITKRTQGKHNYYDVVPSPALDHILEKAQVHCTIST